MTGVPRPVESGRVDSLGRPIKIAGDSATGRADAPPPVEMVGDHGVQIRPGADTPAANEWLRDFRVTGVGREGIKTDGGGLAPSSSCANCGQGIINVVHAKHASDGRTVKLGLDCAERVGLDRAEIRELMREKYHQDRRREWGEKMAEREAALTVEHGEHGSLSRFESGCFCDRCMDAAPHGNLARLEQGCFCEVCVEGAIDSGRYQREPVRYLIDASTGQPIDRARRVNGRYGPSWVINEPAIDDEDDDGWGNSMSSDPIWVKAGAKRRATMLSKGFLEAEAETLTRHGRDRDGWPVTYPVARLAPPTTDVWGEPLEVSSNEGEHR